MSPAVTALYDTREEAERALRQLQAEVSLAHADIYDGSDASLDALQRLDLTEGQLRACEAKLASGSVMLLAQVAPGEDPDCIVPVLERVAEARTEESEPATLVERRAPAEAIPQVVAEERMPLVEEELRVGTREVIRGGARVRARVEELPVIQEVELLEEFVRVDKRPANRRVTEEELDQAGLLRERVIEIAQVREEAVISKEAFVREEVVVSKTTERRVEQINETVRRTEVETENLGVGSHADR